MSTAKSMVAQYKQRASSRLGGAASTLGVGQRAFKSSAANLSAAAPSAAIRAKSTSMSNLVAGEAQKQANKAASIGRPASRSALDNIHMGMNAKYAQVQSKVLLQNIRPQAARQSSPATGAEQQQQRVGAPASRARARLAPAHKPTAGPQQKEQLAELRQQLERLELEREELKRALEQQRADSAEQERQLKQELQDKLGEHERQHDDSHQKLLEAYELADQNRRAADSVLAESRQRDEAARKKIEELEQQLGELREFVAMKDEMTSKMGELREQIRQERERYEEKTRSLNQMFESEKIRLELELMDKVRQVGESYELNKYKTLNRTIELDARLATERLLATKLRLSQLNGENEKLAKQLKLAQSQCREQEKRLLVSETMLRQFVVGGATSQGEQQPLKSSRQLASGAGSSKSANRLVRFGVRSASSRAQNTPAAAESKPQQKQQQQPKRRQQATAAQSAPFAARQQAAVATQTEQDEQRPSRTRAIISELKQKLSLSSSASRLRAEAQAREAESADQQCANTADASCQTAAPNRQRSLSVNSSPAPSERLRSMSLDKLLGESLVRDVVETGEQVVISRGWPAAGGQRAQQKTMARSRSAVTVSRARPSRRLINEDQKRRLLVEFLTQHRQSDAGALTVVSIPRAEQATTSEQAAPASAATLKVAPHRRPRRQSVGRLLVQYELPAHSGEPIALGAAPQQQPR